MKKISVDDLLKSCNKRDYKEQYEFIIRKIEDNKIKPVIASGKNGKTPSLYNSYWIIEEEKDYSVLEEELKFRIHPKISIDYYMKHIEQYEEEREFVLLLNDYLYKNDEKLKYPESVNERSFEIWRREKFISKENGKTILNHCGIDIDYLNVYDTVEPLAYYTKTTNTPQNILIIENKDTFFSMRKHLIEFSDEIFGTVIGTIIYGGGKRIIRSFRDFDFCVEPHMRQKENNILYFGDLDYEGIGMFERLEEIFRERWKIMPFVEAYKAMLIKIDDFSNLPDTKEKQNRNITELFFAYFDQKTVSDMKEILENDKYIPQEIINISDLL
ncbi:MAG: DUF2220 domain-containing protein [Lachnospiraceae bacterium]|nr:DUF2220 domain-containing protein [Lachnospiraceae bacterium]